MGSDGIEVSGNLLPPLAHGLESGGVLGKHEAGVNEANARSVLDPRQNPSNGKWGRAQVPEIKLQIP